MALVNNLLGGGAEVTDVSSHRQTSSQLTPSDYIAMWKEWNKLVWATPIAFIGFLSAIAAIASSMLNGASVPDGATDPSLLVVPTHEILGLLCFAGGLCLIAGARMLRRFAMRRERVSAVLQSFESNSWYTFLGREISEKWQGLDYVTFVLYFFALLLLGASAATLFPIGSSTQRIAVAAGGLAAAALAAGVTHHSKQSTNSDVSNFRNQLSGATAGSPAAQQGVEPGVE